MARQTIADGMIALAPLATFAGYGIAHSAHTIEMVYCAVGALLYLRPLWWSVRYVRRSGLLLTSESVIGSILALLAAPVLLPIVVLRDCTRSRWLAGLVLVYAEIVGVLLWLSPTAAMLMLLPLLSWFSGGLLRLYSHLAKPSETRPLPLLRAVAGWPIYLSLLAAKYLWLVVLNILGAWPLLVLGGISAELAFGNWAQGVLIVAGLVTLPMLFGVACGVLWPSGFDGLQSSSFGAGGVGDFAPIFGSGPLGDFDIHIPTTNPANGLPMVGGFDIHGNPFGTNFNDHY